MAISPKVGAVPFHFVLGGVLGLLELRGGSLLQLLQAGLGLLLVLLQLMTGMCSFTLGLLLVPLRCNSPSMRLCAT